MKVLVKSLTIFVLSMNVFGTSSGAIERLLEAKEKNTSFVADVVISKIRDFISSCDKDNLSVLTDRIDTVVEDEEKSTYTVKMSCAIAPDFSRGLFLDTQLFGGVDWAEGEEYIDVASFVMSIEPMGGVSGVSLGNK